MDDVYEYRRAPSRATIWLSVTTMLGLIFVVSISGAMHLIWLIWALVAMTISLMMLPRPVAGIRIDSDHLILAAWRRPKLILLDDIAYLRAAAVSSDSDVTIVYKDGREEEVFTGDMPDIETLSFVLAAKGVPVRDIY